MSVDRARQVLVKLETDTISNVTPADTQAAQTSGTGELSENDLDAVAGGLPAPIIDEIAPPFDIEPICFPKLPIDTI